MLIRPAKLDDIDSLLQLARESGPGMTNFTDNVESMRSRLELSANSFSKLIDGPDDELYFFVLEDPKNGQLAGCCSVFSSIGIHRPFYCFRVLSLTHTSLELKHYEPVKVLQMVEEHRGCAEIASLYLTPKYRKERNGQLLSRSRFLFMAEFAQRFPNQVIAEMRGKVDENGQSAFWNSLGGRFLPMNFVEADQFNALGHYQFIADMMPKNAIYIRLLSDEAQSMIGVTHSHTQPAFNMLVKEGFRSDGCIDVFDAGPIINCPVDQLRTIVQSQHGTIAEIRQLEDQKIHMASNTRLDDYKLGRGKLKLTGTDDIIIEPDLAQLLSVSVGDGLRFIEF